MAWKYTKENLSTLYRTEVIHTYQDSALISESGHQVFQMESCNRDYSVTEIMQEESKFLRYNEDSDEFLFPELVSLQEDQFLI